MSYVPPPEILQRYASVMVDYGLGDGAGIKAGDVVGVVCPEDAKPLLLEIATAVWRAGGHLIVDFRLADDPDWNMQKAFYEIASDAQLEFYPDASSPQLLRRDRSLPGAARRARRRGRSPGVDPDQAVPTRAIEGPGDLTYRFEKVKAGTLSWSGVLVRHRGDGGRSRHELSRSIGSRSATPATSTTPTRCPGGARQPLRSGRPSPGSTVWISSGCTSRPKGLICG